MRELDDPDLRTYLTNENAYAEAWFAPRGAVIDDVFEEIKSRVQETDMSVPVRSGSWWYVTRTVEGLSYPIHHRGPTAEEATSQVLLDENAEALDHEYFDVGAFDLSHDHALAAWSYDVAGDERYTLRIRDLATGEDLADRIDDVSNAGIAWSRDGAWLFYVTADEQERPYRVWRHRLGDTTGDDHLVFEEDDERFFVGVGETRSDAFVVVQSSSKTSSEVRLLSTDDPTAEPSVVFVRRDDVEYSVDHWGDVLVMHTNDDAVDFRLLTAPTTSDWTDPRSWIELVAHEPGRRISGAEPFADHLVIHEWADAQPRLRILFRDPDATPADRPGRTADERIVDLGNEPHDVDLSSNPEWSTDTLRFGTQSTTVPPTLYDEAVVSGERTLLRRVPTPNVDLADYRSQRLWAIAPDGTSVPIDIVHHVDTPLDGSAPGVIYGYGAYEASMPPWFSVARLSLLDRGFVWALVHPRGGGELGRQWYLDGKLLAKINTFTDTIACAEHLIGSGVVAAGRLAIRGGSAGGLLVGACITMRPDLFCSAVAEVPFVDIVSTMSDPTLPLTVTEWDEWGDPRAEPFASAIAAYSPYDNTVAAAYPAIYATAGLNDPRVSVHEPAKWVARLRAVNTGESPIVLRTEMGAGHGGPTGRYEAWRDEARTLAFLLATT
jgi:oligopeptidase B